MNRLEFHLASPGDAQKVAAFNRRLAAAGESNHHLSVEKPFRTMSHMEDSPITVEKLLCVDGNEVRGGVGIKRMMFQVKGRAEEVAFAVYPLSEGIINRAYGAVGLMIREELLRRYPLMYGLGALNNLLTRKLPLCRAAPLSIPPQYELSASQESDQNCA
jgi:hypothetical protein